MLINVETFLFDALVDAQTVQFLDAIEQSEATGGSPEVDDQDAKALSTEESPAVTIESTIRSRQQTRHQRTQNTANAVYRAGTHRIVDVQHVVDELDGIDQYDTTDETDDDCTEW